MNKVVLRKMGKEARKDYRGKITKCQLRQAPTISKFGSPAILGFPLDR